MTKQPGPLGPAYFGGHGESAPCRPLGGKAGRGCTMSTPLCIGMGGGMIAACEAIVAQSAMVLSGPMGWIGIGIGIGIG